MIHCVCKPGQFLTIKHSRLYSLIRRPNNGLGVSLFHAAPGNPLKQSGSIFCQVTVDAIGKMNNSLVQFRIFNQNRQKCRQFCDHRRRHPAGLLRSEQRTVHTAKLISMDHYIDFPTHAGERERELLDAWQA
jgi:hypothetical protein